MTEPSNAETENNHRDHLDEVIEECATNRWAKETLVRATEPWQSTFDAMEDLVAIVDRDFRVVRANQAMCKAFAAKDVISAHCYELFHNSEGPVLNCPSCQALRSGECTHFETYEQHLGNRWFDIFAYPIKDKDGTVRQLVHVARDITERKKSEDEMQALLQLNQNTLATIPSSLLVLDAELNVIMVNQRYLETRGVQSSEVVGRSIVDVFPRSLLMEQSLLERIREVAVVDGQDELLGVRHTSPEHPDMFLDIRICATRPEPGELRGETQVLLVIDDVTEQRTLEDQVRQAAKMESVGELAGGVAHDFNNILTGILYYARSAAEALPADDQMTQDLAQIRKLADRATNLTRQLLAFSRRQTLTMVVVDINTLVENTSKMLQRLIGEDIDLKFIPAPDVGNVKADPGQVEQVLMNLAVNARHAMPDGGEFTIETVNVTLDQDYAKKHAEVKPGPYVMITVTDTGCGMDEATRARVFDPFFTTKEVGKGTGLGLSTVHGIVKQHGGYIEVHSKPGNGATFKVYLPCVDSEASTLEASARRQSAPRGSGTILVAEDDELVRASVQRALERQGYTVLTAACPKEAEGLLVQPYLSAHGDGKIALLVTDVVMPGCNGRELYELLVEHHPSLRVLYMSGYTDNAVVHDTVLDSNTAFVQKPFAPDDLARKVRDVLDG